jgi:hypothetical protein
MFARIARFEGSDPDAMQQMVERVEGAPGPPEGVPATRFMMLLDREGGTGLAVTFFDTEEDLRAGDEVLNAMTPPVQGAGRRTSVEVYEVAIEVSA